ncbi:MAG: zincin-like metallopeptidase domain-containing protein [Clostridia bacterium]|nr:zincin-like metallopeptidase domain-containing protein [Clostridia bacterium]
MSNEEKNAAYEKLTPQRKQLVDKVMENLEKGNLFWTQGWVSSGAPESAITGKKYRGINNLFLSLIAMSENYGDNRWATFKQMEEKGWTFKKDEEGNSLAKGKGASIEYYEMRDKETKRRFDRSVLDGMTASEQQEYMDKNVYWLRKFYRVFNCSLMDGVPVKEKPQIDVNDRNDRAEAILDYWDKNEAKIVYGGSRAFYRTDTDEVHLPERADFKSMQEFYSTALHEIGHSTGHESRLNRDLSGRFGSEGYAMEELRAEIASIFMEQDLEIEPSEGRLQNNAAYIQSWKEEIKENPNALFTAITDADKIAKYVSERTQEYRQTKDIQFYAIVEETNAYSEQVYKCCICDEEGEMKPLINYAFADREALEKEIDKVKELDIWKDKTFEEVSIDELREKGKTGKVEQEKSTEYIKPSELMATEVAAKALPVSMEGRGSESLTRMSDRETLARAEGYYAKDSKFADLYGGKNVMKNIERSESGLMLRLAMFCGNDEEQLLRIFKSSGQYRDDKPNAYYMKLASESMKTIREMRGSIAAAQEHNGFTKGKIGINSKR